MPQGYLNDMAKKEDHEKLEEIAKLRKRREDRSLKEYYKVQQELYEYEQQIEAQKVKIQEFLTERSLKLQKLQHRMNTEAMNGQDIEAYLLLKEDTQKTTDKYYRELEELTNGYQPKNDAVETVFKQWQGHNNSRQKLDQIAEDKKDEFMVEKNKQEELSRYADFFGKQNQNYD